ncbi:MAG: hypothetical protein LBE34_12535 [Flavobacteriaceae bacterium]|jgi:hypothetical protein|nr:hypothetical protein [Flavobacteriaceae bacterium]
MCLVNIWFYFDNESKFGDLMNFTNGAVFKDSIGFYLVQGSQIHYFNIGDHIGKRSDESLFILCATLPDFLKEPKPIRTQSELDSERLTEIVDAVVRYRKAEMAVPTEWIEEYNIIIERIKNGN